MNVLITGITGFSGSHLAEYLLKYNIKVFGTIRGRCRQTTFIDHIKDKLTLLECDLTDYNSVQATIEECQPDYIYHLAAQTFVPTSWRAPQETINTNVMGTLNLLEAVRKSKFSPKILIAGSSEEYGYVEKKELPITEDNPLASKIFGSYYKNIDESDIRDIMNVDELFSKYLFEYEPNHCDLYFYGIKRELL